MVFPLGRLAAGRLVSTAFATSSARSALFRATAKSQLRITNIYGSGALRRFATAKPVKKASATTTKKTVAKKTAKATTAKKPAKKVVKKAAKKPVKKAVKAKTKAKAKVVGRRPKKPISPERKAIDERRVLREAALFTSPKPAPETAWVLFISDKTKGKTTSDGVGIAYHTAELARQFKALPEPERQTLAARGKENKASNAIAYKRWVQSYTPKQIWTANNARRLLKRKYNIPKGGVRVIEDPRIPKKAPSAFSLFTKSRWESGDHTEGTIRAIAPKIAAEWKATTAAQRQPFVDRALAMNTQYEKALNTALER
ncbi:hypothetical protein GGR50DRAFT_45061 [Xylaria sp. CBS 124048]|nr:hypothetical protein GGR50DRAFT_45061 [Xylaria sp. CBS 124048]